MTARIALCVLLISLFLFLGCVTKVTVEPKSLFSGTYYPDRPLAGLKVSKVLVYSSDNSLQEEARLVNILLAKELVLAGVEYDPNGIVIDGRFDFLNCGQVYYDFTTMSLSVSLGKESMKDKNIPRFSSLSTMRTQCVGSNIYIYPDSMEKMIKKVVKDFSTDWRRKSK